ncbi:putative branched-subunit amino acid permease [Luteococcus japonicus]|uniref:Putative branched-subunit amino acid permease n=1 Tax=Luteococcus japonicus TaxID=33984 RepID=A0A3N1ZY35_9ACTN|nr:AzlC family ABC transporter permease [Luteococcus japonicus]ROR55759.1 putative branched-subunit amino acid permease [Luteococcus japonicus]
MQITPAVRMGLSVSVATGLYGISFGALGIAAGLSVLQTQALSALMFTGGSQFAFVGAIAGGGAPALVSASLLGIRNLIYGAQMNAAFAPRGLTRLLQAHVTIDESVATSVAQDIADEQRRGFWSAGLGVFILWNLFTLLGAVLGNALGDPKTWGLDGAAVAAFLGLLWPRLHNRDTVAIAVASAFVTLLLVPVLAPGLPLLAAAAVAAGMSLWLGRRATR